MQKVQKGLLPEDKNPPPCHTSFYTQCNIFVADAVPFQCNSLSCKFSFEYGIVYISEQLKSQYLAISQHSFVNSQLEVGWKTVGVEP